MKKLKAWIISLFASAPAQATESGSESTFEPVTEVPPPTEQEIADGMVYFSQEYLRWEENALKAVDEIEKMMGAGKAFHIAALQKKSKGIYNSDSIKKLQKIGLVGRPKLVNDRWVVVRDRDLRLKFINSQIGKLTEIVGEYRFHEQALLEYETGKRAPEKKPNPPTLKKVD